MSLSSPLRGQLLFSHAIWGAIGTLLQTFDVHLSRRVIHAVSLPSLLYVG